MVFENNPIAGAFRLEELVKVVEQL
jgi:hypothetical protein